MDSVKEPIGHRNLGVDGGSVILWSGCSPLQAPPVAPSLVLIGFCVALVFVDHLLFVNKVDKILSFPNLLHVGKRAYVYSRATFAVHCKAYVFILPKVLKPIISVIRRKKTTIMFSLQDMFRIFLYPSSVAILNCYMEHTNKRCKINRSVAKNNVSWNCSKSEYLLGYKSPQFCVIAPVLDQIEYARTF